MAKKKRKKPTPKEVEKAARNLKGMLSPLQRAGMLSATMRNAGKKRAETGLRRRVKRRK